MGVLITLVFIMPRVNLPLVTHVVINSGYTSRILTREPADFGEWVRYDDDGEECDDSSAEMPEFLAKRGALYLSDNVWGDGVVILGEDDKEVQKVENLVEMDFGRQLRGHIVFRINGTEEAFRIASHLIELHYCACFSLENIHDISYAVSEDSNTCIMMLSFDTESG